jgi:hypothetical protein
MRHRSVVVRSPIADRRTCSACDRDGLGFDPVGDPAEDGVPALLQFARSDGIRVLLIPRAISMGSLVITTWRRAGAAAGQRG